MGLFENILGLPSNGGNGGDVTPIKRPSKEVEKQDKRRHYEKQEEEMTPEERERAKPPDEPRDGKII